MTTEDAIDPRKSAASVEGLHIGIAGLVWIYNNTIKLQLTWCNNRLVLERQLYVLLLEKPWIFQPMYVLSLS